MLRKRFDLPFFKKFKGSDSKDIPRVAKNLHKREKPVFWFFAIIFLIVLITLVLQIHRDNLILRPSYGGSFSEGIVGRPSFINPVLAVSETDSTLTQLIYSGLLRPLPNGSLETDLASSYQISEDGLTYTVFLKKDLIFHDKEQVSADDVIFTINKVRDPVLKSPLRASWDGVTVEKIDEYTVSFTLEQEYALFPENLTLGILPQHIWKEFTTDDFLNNAFNTSPIGSGPYKISKVRRNNSGVAESYNLSSFDKFALGKPFIDTLHILFYPDQESLLLGYERGEISAVGGVPPLWFKERSEVYESVHFPLARIFAVFLNHNDRQIFTNRETRVALNRATDKERIVENVLGGFGEILFGPLPENEIGSTEDRILGKEEAKNILIENGWEINEDGIFEKKTKNSKEVFAFSMATANVPELKAVAEELKKDWEAIGADIELNIFGVGDLNQDVIRPRDYHTLLFGEVTGRNPDLYAFWHSSQMLDPGLNIAQYANITSDKLLEDARLIADRDERLKTYSEFQKEIETDIPAIFLYSPDYIYLPSKNIKNVEAFTLTNTSDRFINIHQWHIRTDSVWRFLTK